MRRLLSHRPRHNPLTKNQEIAETILSQLGRGRFIAMTGAKDLVAIENGLSMKLGKNPKGVTHLRIILDPALDLYNVEAIRARGTSYKVLETDEGLYAESLPGVITRMTGLLTSLRGNPAREEHRIYVANLAAYNAGKLRGKWIEPSTDADELREQVLEAIGGNPDNEWAFHDYDTFPNMGENPDLDDVAAMAEILEEHPYAIVKAATDFVGDDVDALKEWLDEGYGIYKDEKDYVYSLVDDAGGPSGLGKDKVNFYFDYAAYGQDVLIEADEEDRERYEGMSDEEVGMEHMDERYGDTIPEELADRHFDYDAYAREVFLDAAAKYIPGEGLVVFHAR